MRNICRGIAQLVEQRSPKPRAEGSSPSAPAKSKTVTERWPFLFWHWVKWFRLRGTRSVLRGAGLRWRPLHEVQKHRPSRQARPSPSAPAIDIKPFRSIWLYFFCSFSNTFSNTFNFLWLIDTAWIFSICTKNRWYIKDLQVIKQIIITQCKEYSMQLQNRVPGFVAERCRWQMQRGEDGAAVKIWRNTAIFWAPQEGLRSNFKSVCIS